MAKETSFGIFPDLLTCSYCHSRFTYGRMRNKKLVYIHRAKRKVHCPLKLFYPARRLDSTILSRLDKVLVVVLAEHDPLDPVLINQHHNGLLDIQQKISRHEHEIFKLLNSTDGKPGHLDDRALGRLKQMAGSRSRLADELEKQAVELKKQKSGYSRAVEMKVYSHDIRILLRMPTHKQRDLVNYLLKKVELSKDGIILYHHFNVQPHKISM